MGEFRQCTGIERQHRSSSNMRRLCGAYVSQGINIYTTVFSNTFRHIWTSLNRRYATIFANDGASLPWVARRGRSKDVAQMLRTAAQHFVLLEKCLDRLFRLARSINF